MAYTVTIVEVDGIVASAGRSSIRRNVQDAIKAGLGGALPERVPGFTQYGNAPCVAFCDCVGKLKGLPLNPKATYLWYACLAPQPFVVDHLHGPIVIVTADNPADLQKL
jgi:hypothetical protein